MSISQQVQDRGWNDEVQSYTAAYDGTDLDAATLHIGLSGLIEPSDPRFAATVVATEARIAQRCNGLPVRSDDGLPGTEGGFHLCAAWLVEAYLLTDQRSQAEALFDRLVAAAGPTGLLSEEYDPVAERALGNHPQAYSHLGTAALRATPRRLSQEGGPEVRPRINSVSSTSITGRPDRGGLCSRSPARRPFSMLGCFTVVSPRRSASGTPSKPVTVIWPGT